MKEISRVFVSLKYVILLSFLVFCSPIWAQIEEPQTDDNIIIKGAISLKDVDSIMKMYTYDPVTDRYIYSVSVDDFNIEYPMILTRKQYEDILLKASMREYYAKRLAASEGRLSDEEKKDLLPGYYINSKLFETIFGGNTIDVKPNGTVDVDFGIRFSKQDNPIISPRNRRVFALDFNQRINLSMQGSVGTRLKTDINFSNQSTFSGQGQLIKLNYVPDEDAILQGIEVGNVSMPVNNSLVRGAQNLFGVKTKLQFGKTTFTGVYSKQNSERKTIVAEGGGTVTNFEMFALDYERNKNFFLSQYFRYKYDKSLRNYPYIDSRVRITRVEAWVTSRNQRVNQRDNNMRNIIALQDLGEGRLSNATVDRTIGLDLNINPTFFNNAALDIPSDNANNKFNPKDIGTNFLNSGIRQINTAQAGFNIQVTEGRDYVKLENARKLNPSEFKYHPQLGYITLNLALNNDEVLAVAYEYTVGGKVYRVGEFGTDGIDATVVGQDGDNNDIPTTQSLIVKMLKSTLSSVDEPVWDLMMKNIYALDNAYQLSEEGFRFNILYTDPSPLNYITPAPGAPLPEDVANTPLLNVFNLDRLNSTNDPQKGGDGWFDFISNSTGVSNTNNNQNGNNSGGYNSGNYNSNSSGLQSSNTFEGITVDQQNGRVIFTTIEPFGEHLFKKLGNNAGEDYDVEASYNPNQKKYVYKSMYRDTYSKALQDTEKNKFQLKGRFKSDASDGIPLQSSNVPQGSVVVTAGGRVLTEGQDYTVDYLRGMVQITDPSLKNSDTPIEVSVEDNSQFGIGNRRTFFGFNLEHQVNDKLILGATYLRLSEQPLTIKSNYGNETVNNTIIGFNANYSTDLPFLTRWVNKLPNIDTDIMSTLAFKGEFAYLLPNASKLDQMNGEATSYIENFEGTQSNIDVLNPTAWSLSSVPVGFGENFTDLQSGYRRGKLSWYTIDQIFYSPYRRPDNITDNDISSNRTRRIDKSELFPNMDLANGDLQSLGSLNLSYYPKERGPYNFNPQFLASNELPNPSQNWGGIMRSIASTNFEQSNVEYIEFWMMDPFTGNTGDVADVTNSGKVYFNLGYISEDILQDGLKQYENGLPTPGNNVPTISSVWGKVPASTALIYAFDADGQNRIYQDVGLDGMNDDDEKTKFADFAKYPDPAADNYEFFLTATGDLISRYKNYNGLQGNSPIQFSDTNRGNSTLPDTEDIDNDNTMNTINAYYQYGVNVSPNPIIGENYVVDVRTTTVTFNNGTSSPVKWVQYKVPIIASSEYAVGAISDLQSVRFMRMFLTGFQDEVTLRFASLNLVKSDWRRYTDDLVEDPNIIVDGSNTGFDVTTLNIINNFSRMPIPYVLPPGIERTKVNQNNSVINENEQALSLKVYKANTTIASPSGLEPEDSRAVYKNVGNIDMRQFKKLRMFLHAEATEAATDNTRLKDDEMVAFIRFGNDFTNNFYQVEIPLKLTEWGKTFSEDIWPLANEIELELELLTKLKLLRNKDINQNSNFIYFKDEEELAPNLATKINKLRLGIKGNPNFGLVRTIMVGVRNNTKEVYENTNLPARDVRGEVWFNELRMSDMTNKGGWAANANVDARIADFASVTASVNTQTIGFGALEQGPQERSREDIFQYNITTAVNAHQVLPKDWKLNIPFSYSISEEKITPEYDPNDPDVRLEKKLSEANSDEERKEIKRRSIEYTKRTSVNFVGVNKQRGANKKERFYDVENLTLSHTFNEVQQHNFEVENALDQQARSSLHYSYAFKPWNLEPFKKADGLKRKKYLNILTDFNLNVLPSNVMFQSDVLRQYNQQKYRMIDVDGIEIQPLYRRNYFFNYNYGLIFNLTKSLSVNYTASNNNVVRNYYDDEMYVDNSLGIWNGYFNPGTPNLRMQSIKVDYKLPINKLPYFNFVDANYSYVGDYSWQRATDAFSNIEYNGINYALGNTIQNANTHSLNGVFKMDMLYKSIGLVPSAQRPKKKAEIKAPEPGKKIERNAIVNTNDVKKEDEEKGSVALDALINLVTMVKSVNVDYSESNGTVLPGYLEGLGFFGSSRPTLGFVFGSQEDVRYEAARKGWLTAYPEFNQEFTRMHTEQLNLGAELKPFKDLVVSLRAGRSYSTNMSEQYDVFNDTYNSRSPYEYGNFNISTIMINTAFGKSDVNVSAVFDQFRSNRLIVANRLAAERGIDLSNPANIDKYGYPVGYGRTSQEVLIPAFLSAYQGTDVAKQNNGFLKNIPLPNWKLEYRGLTNIGWFKNHFNRVTISHAYRSDYTVNNYQTNYDYLQNPDLLNVAGNFPSKNVVSNINMVESFSPLIKVEFETKNKFSFGAEIKKDRMLSMSFDNNLLTEVNGNEYGIKTGFRIKDVGFTTNFEGVANGGRIVSDINIIFDFSWRRNQTLIRYLDYNNNLIGAGNDSWRISFQADYQLSKNFTTLFYYMHDFSKAVISTQYPITNIRSGVTLRYNFGN